MRRVALQKTRKTRSKAKSGWHSVKLIGKIKKTVRLAVLAMFAILVSTALIAGMAFYQFIRKPFAATVSTENSKVITSEQPFALSFIVLKDRADESSRISSASLVVINPAEKKVHNYSVPAQLLVNLGPRFGTTEFARSYALGQLLSNKQGVGLTNQALRSVFAKRVDRYILTDEKAIAEFSEAFGPASFDEISKIYSLKNIPKITDNLKMFHDGFETNLTSEELFYLFNLFRTFQVDDAYKMELSQQSIDSSLELDGPLAEVLFSDEISLEQKRVLILNGAGIPGLGAATARSADNFGTSVVGVENASKTYDKSVIYTTDLNSATVKLLAYELGISNVKRVGDADSTAESLVEADITVIIGIDYLSGL